MRTISRTQVDATRAYIWSKNGLPYAYGGSGNPGGDCSWFAFAVAAHVQGMKANRRYGSTENCNRPGRYGATATGDAAQLGLIHVAKASDVPANALVKLGFMHGGGGYNSHVAGTFDGLNFESRGMYRNVSGHVVAGTARAWNDPLFHDFWYLPAIVGAGNPDDFPLPAGWWYGPKEGPEQSVSGEAGEPEYQIAGIRHMQAKLGIPQTGRWRDAQPAISALQRTDPTLTPDGTVGPKTWALIMRLGTPTAPGGNAPMTPAEAAALQWGAPHKVRQQSPEGRNYVNVKDGEMWGRAGLADVWNEVVWDGYKSHVEGDDRAASLVFWVLETHAEAVKTRELVESLQARFASGDTRQQPAATTTD
ncbi:hypothetical protein [Rhodococcoides fascians]|uniref:hypothetical protein n=1 Tax=Rhodococcoides fascians TaxID=1828 RepID=UPI00069055DC|nr:MULTISPECIES: hypothetical protein [Rhodococcus]OZE98071.1 hypothetical protein CH301_17145 [Rhodococcus sp. 15-1189-1-1a]OZF12721.1 hypothetical protein CH299_17830 [Rhodococcus sp. 14-2686-1-2]